MAEVQHGPPSGPSNIADSSNNPTCMALFKALPGKVLLPASNGYSASLKSYFSLQEAEITPYCVVSPANEQDVSTAIKILAAPDSTTKFAIRGGGHTVWKGSANIEDGVTIDMRAINAIEVSENKTVTSVGAGALWRDVYSVLDAMGLATSGGRAAQVGVGGLTTGGGLSFFSARFGFVCDNVLSFDIVLADGTLVSANASSNSDLWVALRGGSNNFGVVTRFHLRTFPQVPFYGGQVFYQIKTAPQQIDAFAKLAGAADFDENASLITSFSYTAQGGAIQNSLKYPSATLNTKPAVFQPFFDIGSQLGQTMRVSNVTDFTTEQGAFSPDGFRQLYRTTTFKNSRPFLDRVYTLWDTTIPTIKPIPGIQWALSIQPIPPTITSRSAPLGGNSLGLSPTDDGPLVNCLLTATWNNTADDELAQTTAVKLFNDIEKEARFQNKPSLYHPYKYLNYADGGQDVIGGYGTNVRNRLRRVSRKYDPRGVFQRQVTGGFKLWKPEELVKGVQEGGTAGTSTE
ncbi:MAG: hypothetical protein L6R38_004507 [Xanthoria sp. 2 TBL-2021]|nr:MAG: hypothetical protein L6R38_004507 [Xanthoria sp. 2 TBL-2021]